MNKSPRVGEELLVRHAVKRDNHGNVTGHYFCRNRDVVPITAVYLGGTVRTGIGDTWKVEMGEKGWMTAADQGE